MRHKPRLMRSGCRLAAATPVRSRLIPPQCPHGRDRTFDFRVGFARHRDPFQHIPQSVTLNAGGPSEVAHCSLSGGSFHSTALARHAAAISRLICITTASMLRRTCMSRLHRAAMPDRWVSVTPGTTRQKVPEVITSGQTRERLGLLLGPLRSRRNGHRRQAAHCRH